jgi:hypothetical protein
VGAALAVCCVLAAAPAAVANGGTKPSLAPTVAVGQQYIGSIGPGHRTEFWRLPPLMANDVVTVAWSTADLTTLCLMTGVDDYSWDTGSDRLCGRNYGSTTGRRFRLVAGSSSPDAFLVFDDPVFGGMSGRDEPYEFTVESIQHWLGVGMRRTVRVSRRGTLTATVTTGDRAAAPDGLVFRLTARWAGRTRTYTAATSRGRARFRLNLPRSAAGRMVSFTVSRPADDAYLAARSSTQRIRVR